MATKTLARWPRVGKYKIRAREKVRKGEGEPGDEASGDLLPAASGTFVLSGQEFFFFFSFFYNNF